jgi:hypothetical protein
VPSLSRKHPSCRRRYQNNRQSAWLHRTLVEVYERGRFGVTRTLAWLGRMSPARIRSAAPVSFRPHRCSSAFIATFSIAIFPDLFDHTMSQDPDHPISTLSPNFQTIFAGALKQYKKQTKKDIAAHSLAVQIESCDSPNAVLTVLQTQVQTFDPSPSANERWTRLLNPTIMVLYAFSGFVSNISGPVNCDIKRFKTYPLTSVTGIPTSSCDFYWHWSPSPGEFLS